MASRTSVISLYGNQDCAYVYYVEGALNSTQAESIENDSGCPEWDTNTQFRIDFSNGLVAGNASFGSDPPTEYKIYRIDAETDESSLAVTLSGDKRGFTDYAIAKGHTYKYNISPASESHIGSAIETDEVSTDIRSWELLVVDDTDEDNVYTLSAIYRFKFNTDDVVLQNNTTINKLRNFTPYMKLQRDQTNCWSGTLSSLAGVYDCETQSYTESVTLLDAIKALSTSLKTKFLRDLDGHLYKIDISSSIEMTQQVFGNRRATAKKLEWTEIGSADDVQIVAAGDLSE